MNILLILSFGLPCSTCLSKPPFRSAVVEFYRRLQKSSRVEILFVDQHLWSAGWQLYEERPDKAWSLTDGISIALMQERGLTEALTNDRHFEQAGLRAILQEPPNSPRE